MTSDSNRGSLVCYFCDSSFTSSEDFSKHLLICGNKTDQCPKCLKFIRRAIFVYHYENNCSNIDEFDDAPSARTTLIDTSPLSCRSNQENNQGQQRATTVITYENPVRFTDNIERQEQKDFINPNNGIELITINIYISSFYIFHTL